MVNPMNDDLGSGFFRGQNPKKTDKEPVSTYHEADNHHWDLRKLYGRQEPLERYREGRPIKEQQEQRESSSNAGAETSNN